MSANRSWWPSVTLQHHVAQFQPCMADPLSRSAHLLHAPMEVLKDKHKAAESFQRPGFKGWDVKLLRARAAMSRHGTSLWGDDKPPSPGVHSHHLRALPPGRRRFPPLSPEELQDDPNVRLWCPSAAAAPNSRTRPPLAEEKRLLAPRLVD